MSGATIETTRRGGARGAVGASKVNSRSNNVKLGIVEEK